MAWVEKRSRRYAVVFRFGGSRYKKLLNVTDRRDAEAVAARAERRIDLVLRGELCVPAGADVVATILGETIAKPAIVIPRGATLQALMAAYLKTIENSSLELCSQRCIQIHTRHFGRIFGQRRRVETIGFEELQSYIDQRARMTGRRGKPLSAATIRKELVTFRALWTWGLRVGQLQRPLVTQGLRFPKLDEKPPFQTYAQISARIARGGLSSAEEGDLWECLYLAPAELDAVLSHIEAHARHGFIYPMVLAAAHTGARRSELIRCEVDDVDPASQLMLLRERKRSKTKRTMRSVPLSARLLTILQEWLATALGRHLFSIDGQPLTVEQANHHLNYTLDGSPWTNIHGWHVFRHSFVSNCASCGIDQRMIDAWTGHQTEDMRRRYRHLLPSTQRSAIETVFGGQ